MDNSPENDWQSCSPEVIDQLVHQRQAMSRRVLLTRFALISASLFTAIAVLIFSLENQTPSQEKGRDGLIVQVKCEFFEKHIGHLKDGQLEDGACRMLQCHMRRCPRCRALYQEHCQVKTRSGSTARKDSNQQ